MRCSRSDVKTEPFAINNNLCEYIELFVLFLWTSVNENTVPIHYCYVTLYDIVLNITYFYQSIYIIFCTLTTGTAS